MENSIQIFTAARSTQSSKLFFILEIPMVEHGRLQKRAFAGNLGKPLQEIDISDICELRDGTILAKTSMGKIRIPSRISNFEGNVGGVSVKTLTARELIALSPMAINDHIYVNQPALKAAKNLENVQEKPENQVEVKAVEEDINYQISPGF